MVFLIFRSFFIWQGTSYFENQEAQWFGVLKVFIYACLIHFYCSLFYFSVSPLTLILKDNILH